MLFTDFRSYRQKVYALCDCGAYHETQIAIDALRFSISCNRCGALIVFVMTSRNTWVDHSPRPSPKLERRQKQLFEEQQNVAPKTPKHIALLAKRGGPMPPLEPIRPSPTPAPQFRPDAYPARPAQPPKPKASSQAHAPIVKLGNNSSPNTDKAKQKAAVKRKEYDAKIKAALEDLAKRTAIRNQQLAEKERNAERTVVTRHGYRMELARAWDGLRRQYTDDRMIAHGKARKRNPTSFAKLNYDYYGDPTRAGMF